MVNPEDFFNLAYKVTHMFLRRNPHLYYIQEDLEQEGLLAVVEASKRFKDTGKIRFSTYCANAVQNKILNYLRDNENKFRTIAPKCLEDLVTPESEDGSSMTWEELVPGSYVDVEQCIHKLPIDLQHYVSLLSEGLTVHEIREKLGCSWEQLEELKERTIDNLRKIII